MGTVQFTNNASSTLAGAISTSDTSLSVQTGDGAKFPTLSAGNWFPLTLVNASGGYEIVQCTARSGDVFTIVRAQEGTAATAFSAGDSVGLRLTAAAINSLIPNGVSLLTANNLSDLSNVATARTNLGLGTAATANTGTGASQVVVRDANGKIPDVSALATVASSGNYYDLTTKLGGGNIGSWSSAGWLVAAYLPTGYGFQWQGPNYGHLIGFTNDNFYIARNGTNNRDGTDGSVTLTYDLELQPGGPLTVAGNIVYHTGNINTASVSYAATAGTASPNNIPVNAVPPVGWSGLMLLTVPGTGSVANGQLVSGSDLSTITFTGSGTMVVSATAVQTGTWMNISNVTISDVNAAYTRVGLFVRTA